MSFIIESVTVVDERLPRVRAADALRALGPPASALETCVGCRVGIREAVSTWLLLGELLSAFYGRDRPLRAVIVTDRGLVTASYPAIPSTIVVNVQLPQWTQDPGQLSMGLEIRCPSYYRAVSLSSQVNCGVPLEPGQYSVCWGEHSVTLRLLDYAYGECTVKLYAYPAIGYPAIVRKIDVPREDLAPVMMQWVSRMISASANLVAEPGRTAYVSMKMPEVVYRQKSIPEFEDKWRIIDFSWLLTPGAADLKLPDVDAYVEDLVELGVIDYYSYAGCRVQIRSPYVPESYEYSSWTVSRAIHTGIPFYVDLSTCRWRAGAPLEVEVSLGILPAGWYVIIPVATVAIDSGATFRSVDVVVYEWGGAGQTVVSSLNVQGPETIQVGQPVRFYSTGQGETRVRITIGEPSAWSGAAWIVVSKVIAIPQVQRNAICYVNPPGPVLPWVTVDLASGATRPRTTSNVELLVWIKSWSVMGTEVIINTTRTVYLRMLDGNWTALPNYRPTIVRPGWSVHYVTGSWLTPYSYDAWPWLPSLWDEHNAFDPSKLTITFGSPGDYVVYVGVPIHTTMFNVQVSPRGLFIRDRVYYDTDSTEPAMLIFKVSVYRGGATLTITFDAPNVLLRVAPSFVIVVEEPEYDKLPPYINVTDGADWAGLVLTGVEPVDNAVRVYVARGGTIVAEWVVPAWVFDSPDTRVLLPITGFFLAYDDADGSIQPDPWLGEPYDTYLVIIGARCGP